MKFFLKHAPMKYKVIDQWKQNVCPADHEKNKINNVKLKETLVKQNKNKRLVRSRYGWSFNALRELLKVENS